MFPNSNMVSYQPASAQCLPNLFCSPLSQQAAHKASHLMATLSVGGAWRSMSGGLLSLFDAEGLPRVARLIEFHRISNDLPQPLAQKTVPSFACTSQAISLIAICI